MFVKTVKYLIFMIVVWCNFDAYASSASQEKGSSKEEYAKRREQSLANASKIAAAKQQGQQSLVHAMMDIFIKDLKISEENKNKLLEKINKPSN